MLQQHKLCKQDVSMKFKNKFTDFEEKGHNFEAELKKSALGLRLEKNFDKILSVQKSSREYLVQCNAEQDTGVQKQGEVKTFVWFIYLCIRQMSILLCYFS